MPAVPYSSPSSPMEWEAKWYETPTQRRSKLFRTRVQAELHIARHCCATSHKDFPGFLCETVLELHFENEERRGIDRKGRKAAESQLRRFMLKPFATRTIGSLTSDDIAAVRVVIEEHYGADTAYRACNLVLRFMTFAHAGGFIRKNPAPVAMEALECPPSRPQVVIVPTPTELTELAVSASASELVLMLLMTRAGTELRELTRMEWCDVKFDEHRLFVRHIPLICDDPDNPEGRWITMTPDLEAALLWWKLVQRRWRPNARYVFEGHAGYLDATSNMTYCLQQHQIRQGVLARSLRAAGGVIAGKARYRAEHFRHVAALAWCAEGLTVKALQKRLGYQSVDTVEALYGKYIKKSEGSPS